MGVLVWADRFTSDLELMQLSPLFHEQVNAEIRPEVTEVLPCSHFQCYLIHVILMHDAYLQPTNKAG